MNKQNLKTLSPSEARENGSKGGMKSAEARRQRKLLRELVDAYGVTGCLSEEARKKLQKAGIAEEDFTRDMEIVVALYDRACKGDVAAFNAIRDIKGEKPTENMAASLPNAVEVRIIQAQRNEFASSEEEITE